MIIAINNNKGGSLKSTVATNLAGVLANMKKKVLIVDADSQSNIALTFGLNPDNQRTTLYDVLLDGVPAEDAIVTVHNYIDILPSNTDLVNMDFRVIPNRELYPEPFSIMKNTLSHLESKYDYVLVDTPPSLSLIVGNAFAWADKVLIPFTPEYYSLRSLISVVNTVGEFVTDHNSKLEVLGILPTLVKANTNLHQDLLQQTRRFADKQGLTVFETHIPSTIQFANAVRYHKVPATLVAKKKEYDKAELFVDVWKEIEAVLRKDDTNVAK